MGNCAKTETNDNVPVYHDSGQISNVDCSVIYKAVSMKYTFGDICPQGDISFLRKYYFALMVDLKSTLPKDKYRAAKDLHDEILRTVYNGVTLEDIVDWFSRCAEIDQGSYPYCYSVLLDFRTDLIYMAKEHFRGIY